MKKLLVLTTVLVLFISSLFAQRVVTVYTDRHYEVDSEIFKMFEQRTGVKVNVFSANSDQLLQRLALEDKNTPADLLIIVDVGRLHHAKRMNLLQPVNSEYLMRNIPEKLRDEGNHWFALTKRARIIVYSKKRVNPAEIKTYDDLTNQKWKGKVLVRSSTHVYNRSLLASFIALYGEEYARNWAAKVVQNLARDPSGNDRDQIRAIAAGIGDIAIVNSYYIGLMMNSKDPDEQAAVREVGVIFPNPTHVNITGMGLTRFSKNKEDAIKLMEFLLTPEIQRMYAEANFEYPVNPAVKPASLLVSWGTFVEQNVKLSLVGELSDKAIMIFNQVGWK
ncbi:Fe(3+) ABC transporter substrate-binding protein [Fervidobacterium islandicum]|uniref:Fe(3+) ABC transporter substrate-binding protein n=1 Tax=Fervidobacterium islandicum TaxID=2423 RepID=UPI003A6C0215